MRCFGVVKLKNGSSSPRIFHARRTIHELLNLYQGDGRGLGRAALGATPLRSIKTQYFLSFAVMGSVLPFLSVLLKERGLSRAEIGYVTGAASAAVVLTPVLVTLLADGYVAGRRLLGGVFSLSGVMLLAVWAFGEGFWPLLVLYTLYYLSYAPITALQDGVFFLSQSQGRLAGQPTDAYHRVRVWGTAGFMAPSVLLFVFLLRGLSVEIVLLCAVVFCLLGWVNSLTLPRTVAPRNAGLLPTAPAPVTSISPAPESPSPDPQRDFSGRVPTLEAAKAMLEPHVLVFCIAMGLTHMANAAYYAFYPLYLTDHVGLSHAWVGVIANVGVFLEIFYMLGFGAMLSRLGIKRLMMIGMACLIVRLGLLAASDSIAVAVGTQVVHGLIVLVMHVAPPIYLNRCAEDRYRNSMQGLYTMVVYGVGRIAGNLLAGVIAQRSLSLMFISAAGLGVIAVGLFWFAFHDRCDDRR